MQSLEQKLESLLLRNIPNLDKHWQGASENEIREIELLAGCPLPRTYKWFLERLGRDAGPLLRFHDFSADKVLACYREERVDSQPERLLIADVPDPQMPMYVYLDLSRPIRNDAYVLYGPADGAIPTDEFETFREMIAWCAIREFRIRNANHNSLGIIRGQQIAEKLSRVMKTVGFDCPIETGPYCCIFERHDAAMVCQTTPSINYLGHLIYNFGGEDIATLRMVLGMISLESSLEVEVSSWSP